MKFGKGLFGWVLFIALAVMLFMLLNKQQANSAPLSIGELARHLERDNVSYVDLGEDQLYGEFRPPQIVKGVRVQKFRVPLPAGASGDWALTQWLLDTRQSAGIGVADKGPNLLTNIIIPLIPWVLIFGFIWFFVYRQLRNHSQSGEIKPWPVYIVSSPDPIKPGAPIPIQPMSPPAPPNTPAPGGDN
jgi:ATP-dependent Zn protease